MAHRELVAEKKVKRFADWQYWGKPLPGFGDPEAKLLIIGLAPATHGGNRTGRMFTGDDSGTWLARALYKVGFANQPSSESKDDGLKLESTYVTAVVRCAPPANKPTKQEIQNCSKYLQEELRILKNVKVVLTLGRIAFGAYTSHLNLKLRFKHGALYKFKGLTIIASYHPSRQNTQTKKLTWNMWIDIFKKVKKFV